MPNYIRIIVIIICVITISVELFSAGVSASDSLWMSMAMQILTAITFMGVMLIIISSAFRDLQDKTIAAHLKCLKALKDVDRALKQYVDNKPTKEGKTDENPS